MSKIGILGGTFDPIHKGHLRLGQQAFLQFELDEIWFMPSGQPPHKKDHKVTDGALRRDMVKQAIAGIPWFVYSDFELEREGNTYTARTLALLKEMYPQHEFYFIIGADSLYQIELWYHPEEVMRLSVLLVAGRPYRQPHKEIEQQIKYLEGKYGARIFTIQFQEMDISSAEIRKLAAEGCPIASYVPEPVEAYIRSHSLYHPSAHITDEKGEIHSHG